MRNSETLLLHETIKTGLGKSDASSALTSIVNVVLKLENDSIPATIEIKKLSLRVDFRGSIKNVETP